MIVLCGDVRGGGDGVIPVPNVCPYLCVVTDLLKCHVHGCGLVVTEVDGDLSHIQLIQIPPDGLHRLETTPLGRKERGREGGRNKPSIREESKSE